MNRLRLWIGITALVISLTQSGQASAQVTASQSRGFITADWNAAPPPGSSIQEIYVSVEDARDGDVWDYTLPAGTASWTSPRRFLPGRYMVFVTALICDPNASCSDTQGQVGHASVSVPNTRPRIALLRVIARRNPSGVNVRIRFRVCDDSEEIRLRAIRRYRYLEDAPVTDRKISQWLLHRRNATRPRCGRYHATFQVWTTTRRQVAYYVVTLRAEDENGASSRALRVNVWRRLPL